VVFTAREGRYGEERVFADGELARSAILEGLEFAVADVMP
jgi:hypothetical protein